MSPVGPFVSEKVLLYHLVSSFSLSPSSSSSSSSSSSIIVIWTFMSFPCFCWKSWSLHKKKNEFPIGLPSGICLSSFLVRPILFIHVLLYYFLHFFFVILYSFTAFLLLVSRFLSYVLYSLLSFLFIAFCTFPFFLTAFPHPCLSFISIFSLRLLFWRCPIRILPGALAILT
jgi:hypothetical protein